MSADRKPEYSGNQESKPSLSARPRYLFVSGFMGTFFGGIAYGTTRLLSDPGLAEKVGLGVGGAFASGGLGATFSGISTRESEYHRAMGNKVRARLRSIQSRLEAAAGYGFAGALAGFEAGGLTYAAVGGGIGAAWGGFGGHLKHLETVKDLPEEILPEGNSMVRDTRFPEWGELGKCPPVYRVSSFEDLKEYREANKERIMKAAMGFPQKSNNPNQLHASWTASAVAIVPDIQHFPVDDPEFDRGFMGKIKEKSFDMKLRDSRDSVVVHPCLESHFFWPYQTIFEAEIGKSRHFQDNMWAFWREKSWKHGIVLLVQYQLSSRWDSHHDPEKVVDNYWLLDILTDEGGVKKRVKEEKPVAEQKPAFNPQQI